MNRKKRLARNDNGKIRIAFVLWTLEGMGGSEHVVFDIVQKLDKNRFDVLVIGFKEGPVRSIYEGIGVKVAVISKKRKYDLKFIQEMRNILKKECVQVVNAHHFSPLLYSYLATVMTNVKLIYTEHSVWQYLEMSRLKTMLSNFLLWKTDAVVAISKQLLQYYRENPFVSGSKTYLIVNGIDLLRYKCTDRKMLKKELGFKRGDILIGMVANLRPEKNHKILISAFSILSRTLPDCHLMLVGLDCMDGEIQRYSKTMDMENRIHFLGPREDVDDLLNIFDVFCLPSANEGLPLTILEAMACGVPVVGSNVMGINEVINDNVNGLLFPDGDETALAEKIKMLAQDESLRSKLHRAGLAYVKKNYCLDDKIREYVGLFQKLLSRIPIEHHSSCK